MSFRKLSLIFITLLLTSVLLIQWWSITRFTENVAKQIGESAFEVSRLTAEKLIFEQPKIEFTSIAFTSSTNQTDNQIPQQQKVIDKTIHQNIQQMMSRVRQDVVIQLIDKQKDDFILLNADGSEYQIPVPRTGIHQSLEAFSKNVLISTLALLLIGIILAIYFTHKISTPLKKLQSAALALGDGSLGTQISKDKKWHSTEIDTTIDSFNQMSLKIQELQYQNELLHNKAHLAEIAEISKGLAHTIRNPLNTLNLAIDQMQSMNERENLNEQEKSQHSKLALLAKHQITRIDKWVRSLMEVMSNNENLIADVDLTALIVSVIDDQKLSNQKITFQFNHQIENKNDSNIVAIEPELKSLIQSLIANSVEASPEDSLINISLEKISNGYQIQITDQGKGFSEKILAKLFTPHNTDKTYGAGMGLYLAERVIKHKYSGELNVKNNSVKGSTITMTLSNRTK